MLAKTYQNNLLEAGLDEAGRGCLAGPVVAAAVILPKEMDFKSLNDSKKLNENQRNQLRVLIENESLAFAIGICSADEIDKHNILKASILAMHKAVNQLQLSPELLLVDGNKFMPFKNLKHKCIVKGDGKYQHIAAASILAKTYRDEIMEEMHQKFPVFNWKQNKGYPTKEHRIAIRENGFSIYHRKSFHPNLNQLDLFGG
jgi:ribonuclease HII